MGFFKIESTFLEEPSDVIRHSHVISLNLHSFDTVIISSFSTRL
eukprot:SAG22_NODE_112_length_19423_cov_11.462223_13_plen_44_part_00